MFKQDKAPKTERQANQELQDQKMLDYNAFLDHVSIMNDYMPTWKQRRQAEKKAKMISRAQDILFIIEGLLIIGLLWLIAPQVIEQFFN